MDTQEDDLDKLVKAISWKLYLEPDDDEYKRNWDNFSKNDPNFQQKIANVCNTLAAISAQMFAKRLNIDNLEKQKNINFLELMWKICLDENIFTTVNSRHYGDVQERVRCIFRDAIRRALTSFLPEDIPLTAPSSEPEANLSAQNSDPLPAPTSAQWKYLPVQDVPDMHEEYSCKSSESPEKLKLIGARVRGKAHKHEGTNCDDWFEFAISGNWTIIAVSDGAGSKKFSRIGAQVSCEAAVKYLTEKLKDLNLQEREIEGNLTAYLGRDANWGFLGEDMKSVQQFLHQAIEVAYKAVEQAAAERQGNPKYSEILNQEIQVSDLSATILLAVHTTIKAKGKTYNLALTCQIGDGMIAAISMEGKLELLGKPDSGDYGGQTEFLTSKNKLQPANLLQKTFVFPGNLRALMVMTDGVADDYFPYEPGMLALYGDLVLNQVIQIYKHQDIEEINSELKNTRLGSFEGVKDAKDKFQSKIVRIIDPSQKDEAKEVSICSVDDYAKELGKSVLEVVDSPILLAAGILEEQMCNECHHKPPEEKLQLWLDSYYRRASFDDRTLVVLYREES